ncbi:MAG: hypothetical protein M1816_003475 [Peltula sp. TS41687]|nr:MAG: hypothetical protein M1816_003475 [Peltula sp. TS41687]
MDEKETGYDPRKKSRRGSHEFPGPDKATRRLVPQTNASNNFDRTTPPEMRAQEKRDKTVKPMLFTTHHSLSPIGGLLKPSSNSLLHESIVLDGRKVSWGRGKSNTQVHPNEKDSRIPKYAIEVLFWKEGLQAHEDDWTELPAVIRTGATQHIWINGIRLVKNDESGNQYGRIYSGDVICIWRDKKTGEEISFVCEFYRGPSARERPRFEIWHF